MHILLIIYSIFLLSCSNVLKKESPTKKYYLLEADYSKIVQKNAKQLNLKILKTKISPFFEGKNFIYKQGSSNYDSDYYNEFLVFPSININEIINKWIIESGYSSPVVNYEEPNFLIQVNVDSLYSDISDDKNISVFLDIQFIINKSGDKNVLYNKKFSKKKIINELNAELIVKSWNEGLTEILIEFSKDLSSLNILK